MPVLCSDSGKRIDTILLAKWVGVGVGVTHNKKTRILNICMNAYNVSIDTELNNIRIHCSMFKIAYILYHI